MNTSRVSRPTTMQDSSGHTTSDPTMRCIQVVPDLYGVVTTMSSGRGW